MNGNNLVVRLSYVPLFGEFQGVEKSKYFTTTVAAVEFIQRMNQFQYDNYELTISWRTPESE